MNPLIALGILFIAGITWFRGNYLITLAICTLVLVFSQPSIASSKDSVTVTEAQVMQDFTSKVNKALILADACHTRLLLESEHESACYAYSMYYKRISNSYNRVMKIERKRRFAIIAGNNNWSKAFNQYDMVLMIVREIKREHNYTTGQ